MKDNTKECADDIKKMKDIHDKKQQKIAEGESEETTTESEVSEEETKIELRDIRSDYIVDFYKYPIPIGRIGLLPPSVQKFLHIDNLKCLISNTDRHLKQNHPCLLRYGIEQKKNKSFIGVIAKLLSDAQTEETKNAVNFTIKDTIQYIQDKLSLDHFSILHSGQLINTYYSKELHEYDNSNPEIKARKLSDAIEKHSNDKIISLQ